MPTAIVHISSLAAILDAVQVSMQAAGVLDSHASTDTTHEVAEKHTLSCNTNQAKNTFETNWMEPSAASNDCAAKPA